MTTTAGARPGPGEPPATRGARHRRSDQRRLALEKVLAGLALFVAFAVTVALLGLQWLGNQGTSASVGVQAGHLITSEVQAS
ncbi:MAG: hypothetical protein M1435_03575 [Actinobacteria bacterium]|nr:hypothetical protein [Actinomycetota bacterium]